MCMRMSYSRRSTTGLMSFVGVRLPTLCHFSYTRQSARTAAYLVDIHSRERFWATAIHFTVPMSRRIKTKTWKLTQKTLSAGLDGPLVKRVSPP